MKAAVYYSNKDVRIEERPKPVIGDGEILVRVEASGICATDCLEWYRINKVPLVLGHEIAGVITEIGKGVKDYKIGDRVTAAHHVPCGECRYCLDGHETVCDTLRKTNFDPGGFSEYIRVPKINVEKGTFILPKGMTFDEATFIEPLACVIRGQKKADVRKDKSVLVIGSGIAGLLHAQLAKINGASRVIATDVVDFRLKAAKKLGADFVFNAKEFTPELLKKVNDGLLADRVIVCAGAGAAFDAALKSVERGGTVLFFAGTDKGVTIPLSINDVFWRNEITITSSYAGSPDEHRKAIELINSHKINVCDMISHKFSLKETGMGFKLVAEAKDSIKIIIEPQR